MLNQAALPARLMHSDLPQSLSQNQKLTATMHPLVIDERLISLFKYWNGTVQQGMWYNQGLYQLLQTYSAHERLQAYAVAYDHAEKGEIVCITVSKNSYRLWLGLRSPTSDANLDSPPTAGE